MKVILHTFYTCTVFTYGYTGFHFYDEVMMMCVFVSIKVPSSVIGRFSDILAAFIRCDSYPNTWEVLPLVYSCLICIVTSLRKNEGILIIEE